jgi:hypothetical protein
MRIFPRIEEWETIAIGVKGAFGLCTKKKKFIHMHVKIEDIITQSKKPTTYNYLTKDHTCPQCGRRASPVTVSWLYAQLVARKVTI